MSSGITPEIEALATQVRDTGLPVVERRKALSLIAQLRGETYIETAGIAEGDLTQVVNWMTVTPKGVRGPMLQTVVEGIAAGRQMQMNADRKPPLV